MPEAANGEYFSKDAFLSALVCGCRDGAGMAGGSQFPGTLEEPTPHGRPGQTLIQGKGYF